jgi:hypothetical protein
MKLQTRHMRLYVFTNIAQRYESSSMHLLFVAASGCLLTDASLNRCA